MNETAGQLILPHMYTNQYLHLFLSIQSRSPCVNFSTMQWMILKLPIVRRQAPSMLCDSKQGKT